MKHAFLSQCFPQQLFYNYDFIRRKKNVRRILFISLSLSFSLNNICQEKSIIQQPNINNVFFSSTIYKCGNNKMSTIRHTKKGKEMKDLIRWEWERGKRNEIVSFWTVEIISSCSSIIQWNRILYIWTNYTNRPTDWY